MTGVFPGLPPIMPVAAPVSAQRDERRAQDSAPQIRPQTQAGLDAAGRSEAGYGGPDGRRGGRGRHLDITI
ncbi:MAG: hypothetical protein RID91_12170 [Azospirillaceae bacterium]